MTHSSLEFASTSSESLNDEFESSPLRNPPLRRQVPIDWLQSIPVLFSQRPRPISCRKKAVSQPCPGVLFYGDADPRLARKRSRQAYGDQFTSRSKKLKSSALPRDNIGLRRRAPAKNRSRKTRCASTNLGMVPNKSSYLYQPLPVEIVGKDSPDMDPRQSKLSRKGSKLAQASDPEFEDGMSSENDMDPDLGHIEAEARSLRLQIGRVREERERMLEKMRIIDGHIKELSQIIEART